MAIIEGGILGITSGKVGPVIASSWRGKNYIRSKGGYKDKKSDLQQIQRDRYTFITEVGTRAYQNIIKPAMIKAVEGLQYSAWNLYTKLNILADDVYNKRYNLQISSGARKLPTMLSCTIHSVTKSFYISWSTASGSNSSPSDSIWIYRLRSDSYILEPVVQGTKVRSDGSYAFVAENVSDFLGHNFLIFAKSSTGIYSSTSGMKCIDSHLT